MIDDFTPPRSKKPAPPVATQPDKAKSEPPVEPPFEPAVQVEPEDLTPNLDNVVSKDQSKIMNLWSGLARKLHTSPKRLLIIGVAVFLLGTGSLVWWFTKPAPPQPQPVVKQEPKPAPPEPTTIASRLTGLEVPKELDKLPVSGVMIENSPDARPQSGLKDAGVVFEAIAEGGITRFLAMFHAEMTDYIGPVRSVRPYYLDFVAPFDAGIVHAGGSGQALAEVQSGAFKDMEYGFYPGHFQRVNNRYAPHNLYTSRAELLKLHNIKGWVSSDFKGFTRKPDKPIPVPPQKTLDFAVSSFLYNPHYDYNPVTNSYNRSQANQPHVDERSGAQISPKVVIALVMPRGQDSIYSVYQTTGKGKAYIFQDGGLTEGFWEKPNRQTQITLTDASGAPVPINAGPTWFTLVSSITEVSAKP